MSERDLDNLIQHCDDEAELVDASDDSVIDLEEGDDE
jgi:hypothetical protein